MGGNGRFSAEKEENSGEQTNRFPEFFAPSHRVGPKFTLQKEGRKGIIMSNYDLRRWIL